MPQTLRTRADLWADDKFTTPVVKLNHPPLGRWWMRMLRGRRRVPIAKQAGGDWMRELSDDQIKTGSDKIKAREWIRIHPLQSPGPCRLVAKKKIFSSSRSARSWISETVRFFTSLPFPSKTPHCSAERIRMVQGASHSRNATLFPCRGLGTTSHVSIRYERHRKRGESSYWHYMSSSCRRVKSRSNKPSPT